MNYKKLKLNGQKKERKKLTDEDEKNLVLKCRE